jgi:HTH-like domain
MLQARLGLSERRACRLAGQNRSTQRHCPQVAQDDAALRKRLRKISEQRPRWGLPPAHGHLLSEGWSLNRKRVQRIWREEGLRVPRKAKKRRRLGESTTAADRLRAEFPNHVWALDYQHDATGAGAAGHPRPESGAQLRTRPADPQRSATWRRESRKPAMMVDSSRGREPKRSCRSDATYGDHGA